MARIVDGKIILEIGDEAVIDVLRDVAANNAARKNERAQAVARPDSRSLPSVKRNKQRALSAR